MFERFRSFLDSLTGHGPHIEPGDPRIAIAALCIQVMEADGEVHEKERKKIRSMVKEHYQLDDASLDALIVAGEAAESQAIDYFRFTSDIKRHFSEEQRIDLIGMLWEIVYADGKRSEMEDHVIWRIADLLGVSGRDRIIKRQEVAAKLDVVEETTAEQEQ
ncbi:MULTISPECIES: TerB family tellurite resistance protein [unclassified Rhizobium]|uniref:tellurite resistance TerB family protein n=1 Tax=unclassified Rhizobium TaxID=2613769 RepID=UPI0007162CF8|nr:MULTISPECIES: TerB family tellurite resistance protein [unclassified Rhizobium]KQS83874.1 hypothetical protein ASG50_11195 [Rhizobium sp. Leaf386]KQT05014.1 hypothetical protein ASG42_22885 [Rhizobium sp. Leaf391]KQU08815.1 hypothetical protein ASG68_21840 [Rhizobium sp. Leaf453]